MSIAQHRQRILDFSCDIKKLLEKVRVDLKPITALQDELKTGYLKVVVIAEINTGKSTFLNALMGAKIFPSRAVAWTASITLLDHGDEPRAEVYHKNGKMQKIPLDREKPIANLKAIVTKENPEIKNINLVKVWFPNPFTRQGIVLVDTPGVNDPENWREDITFDYLPQADAAIMLFDPQTTWTASEKEFLTEKVMKSNVSNFVFVINRKDEVSPADLPKSIHRLKTELGKIIPNPTILAVSSLNALNAKLENDATALAQSGFPELEKLLLEHLFQHSAGGLFLSKTVRLREMLQLVHRHWNTRQSALHQSHEQFQGKLESSRRDCAKARKILQETSQKIKDEKDSIANQLQQAVSTSLAAYRNQNNPNVDEAKSILNKGTRDANEALRQKAQELFGVLVNKYANLTHTQLSADSHALALIQNNVEVDLKIITRKGGGEAVKFAGLGIGALIGWGIFSFFSGGILAGVGALLAFHVGGGIAKAGLSAGDHCDSTEAHLKASIQQLERALSDRAPTVAQAVIEALHHQCVQQLEDRIRQHETMYELAQEQFFKNQHNQEPERLFLEQLKIDLDRVQSGLQHYQKELEAQIL